MPSIRDLVAGYKPSRREVARHTAPMPQGIDFSRIPAPARPRKLEYSIAGQRLSALIYTRGYSARQFVREKGVSRRALMMLLYIPRQHADCDHPNGRQNIRAVHVLQIAKALDVKPRDFLTPLQQAVLREEGPDALIPLR